MAKLVSKTWGIFQIMPNHFHAIIELQNAVGADPHDVGADLRVCPGQPRWVAPTHGQNIYAPTHGLNIDAPTHDQNIIAPTHGQTIITPTHGQNIDAPTHGQNIDVPTHDKNIDAPTHGQNIGAPTHGQNIIAPTHAQRRLTLGDVVGRFKSLTTRLYIDGIHANHWPPFTKRLWQRNYFEHIIRHQQDYQTITDYIRANPHNWEKDREYPLK